MKHIFSFGEGYMTVRITPQTLTWNAISHMAKEIDFEIDWSRSNSFGSSSRATRHGGGHQRISQF